MTSKITLFDRIAPIYGLFYEKQKRWFKERFDKIPSRYNLNSYKTVIDIGCGTGALSSVFHKKGYQVVGIDIAEKMLEIGRGKEENQNIDFIYGDVLKGLQFPDQSFDIAFASYVAHGLEKEDRLMLYGEMNRLAKELVIIQDYNKNRNGITSFIEWMEGGDYFQFIQLGKKEMEEVFKRVEVIDVDIRASWYLCKPKISQ